MSDVMPWFVRLPVALIMVASMSAAGWTLAHAAYKKSERWFAIGAAFFLVAVLMFPIMMWVSGEWDLVSPAGFE